MKYPLSMGTIVSTVLFAIISFGALAPRGGYGAEAKSAWQTEWENVLTAAKKEGQVAVYISGYEEILPEFQKEFPDIKVQPTTGRGSQVGQRSEERRVGKSVDMGGRRKSKEKKV